MDKVILAYIKQIEESQIMASEKEAQEGLKEEIKTDELSAIITTKINYFIFL